MVLAASGRVSHEDLANIAVRTTVDAAADGWSFNEYCMELGAALQGQVYAQMVRHHLEETADDPRWARERWVEFKKIVKQSAFDMTRRVSFAKWYAEKKGLDYWHRRVVAGEQDQRDVALLPDAVSGVSRGFHLHGEG